MSSFFTSGKKNTPSKNLNKENKKIIMPPKKAKEDLADKPPEGESERLLTITVHGKLSMKAQSENTSPDVVPQQGHKEKGGPTPQTTPRGPTMVSKLFSPFFSLCIPPMEPGLQPETISTESLSQTEQEFTVVLLSRKVTITPPLVNTFLAGEFKVSAHSCTESKPLAEANTGKGGAGKGGGGKGGKGGGAGKSTDKAGDITQRSEASESSILHLSRVFHLDALFSQKTEQDVFSSSGRRGEEQRRREEEGGSGVEGFEELVISIKTSDVLFSPANLIKYQPFVVEVIRAYCLPPLSTLPLNIKMNEGSNLPDGDESKLVNQYDGVCVQYNFLGTEIATTRVPHQANVQFSHKKIFFLFNWPKIQVYQKIFFEGIRFQLHDRDAKDSTIGKASGMVHISLRRALDGDQRFIFNEQVLPFREDGNTAPVLRKSDYLSLGTTLQTKVHLFIPLPPVKCVFPPKAPLVTAVSSGGSPPSLEETADKFLTRLLIVMPYSDGSTKAMVHAIMGTLVTYPKAQEDPSGDVTEYTRPPTPPPEIDPKAAKAQAKGGAPEKKGAVPVVEAPPEPKPAVMMPLQLLVSEGVSGFELMDGVFRIICVEGPCQELAQLAEVAASVAGPNESIHIFFNHALMFPKRFYHMYPPLIVPLVLPPDPAANPPVVEALLEEKTGKGGKAPVKPSGQQPAKPRASPDKPKTDIPPISNMPTGGPGQAGSQSARGENASGGGTAETVGTDRNELDGGGVGGRIRRIRLSEPLSVLRKRQSLLLRRAITKECITAIDKLNNLLGTASMMYALDHDYFPTAAEIISLERISGQTLETYDVCAGPKFVNFSTSCVEDVVKQAVKEHNLATETVKDDTINFSDLNRFVGRVTSFEGMPATPDQIKRLPNLTKKLEHYTHKAYMYNIEKGVCVPCVFHDTPPTQLLRFDVTAQVIAQDGGASAAVLYVMSCISLAKRGVDSHNPAFEEIRRLNKRKAPANMTKKLRAQERAHYRATHQITVDHSVYHDDSSDDSENFLDPPPRQVKMDGDGTSGGGGDISGGEDPLIAVENYVEFNREKLKKISANNQMHRQLQGGVVDYDWCEKLDQKLKKKEAGKEKEMELLRSQDKRPAFSTHTVKTAEETHRHPLAPSGARVDDLKAPWEPPGNEFTGFKSAADDKKIIGNKKMRIDGAKDILGNPYKIKSVFAGSAVEIRHQEEQDKKQAIEDWKHKVVVDDPRFKVSCRIPKDKNTGNSIDKYKNLLEGVPAKYSVKMDYVAPNPISIREAEKLHVNEKVDPSMSKHPESRKFYYAKQLQSKLNEIKVVSEEEKRGPLWAGYEQPRFKD